MSLPGNRVYCTGCDFEQYVFPELIQLRCRTGNDIATYGPRVSWCYECNRIVDAEGIPSIDEIRAEMAEYESREPRWILYPITESERSKIEELVRQRICRGAKKAAERHCLFCGSIDVEIMQYSVDVLKCNDCSQELSSSDLPCVDSINDMLLKQDKKAMRELSAKADIKRRFAMRELQSKLKWRQARSAPPRCLSCGSAATAYLSFYHAVEVSITRAMAKDFVHACGGSLICASDQKSEIRYAFKNQLKWTDMEGNILRAESVVEYEDALIDYYCQYRDRICPKPDAWKKIWEMLPNKRKTGIGWEPPLPLILAAWNETSDIEKQERLAEHVRWSVLQGCYNVVANALLELPEENWHHRGEV